MKRFTLLLLVLTACSTTGGNLEGPPEIQPAQPRTAAPSQSFMPIDWDAANGKLMMQIARFGDEFLYVVSLPAGVGSNPIGLDRGEMGDTHLVHFERVGPKVLLIESNTRFRALTNDPNERRAVEDSFARSVLAAFKVEKTEGETVTIDATDFFLSDMHGVTDRLRVTQQGSYA